MRDYFYSNRDTEDAEILKAHITHRQFSHLKLSHTGSIPGYWATIYFKPDTPGGRDRWMGAVKWEGAAMDAAVNAGIVFDGENVGRLTKASVMPNAY